KLPAGHLLRFRDRSIAVRRWWFPEHARSATGRTRGELIEQLRSLLADSVRIRLRADVPLALCLSGGIDSSVIAAECVRRGARLDAFTLTFEEDRTDLPYARAVAENLGLAHEVVVTSQDCVARQIENAAANYDEPFADSSALPSLALARVLSGRYKVI